MKTPSLSILVLLGLAATQLARAAPPAQVGDSLFYVALQEGLHDRYIEFLYLGPDGTCKLLSSVHSTYYTPGEGSSGTTFGSSQSGAYTYGPSNLPNTDAAITINIGANSDVYQLTFFDGTSGQASSINGSAVGPFSLLIAAPNVSLANVSNRVTLRSTDTAISGFVIEGGATRLVLIRAVGPSLAAFGVSPVSGNPRLNLFTGTGTGLIGSGQKWCTVLGIDAQAMGWIFGLAGAFQLQSGSNDVVILGLLGPGVYTAGATDATTGAGGGSALTEVYILPYSGNLPPDLPAFFIN